jgi:30S ribosomal protein S31
MGKGDKKTRRGKITIGTFGVRRPRKKNKPIVVVTAKKKTKAPAKPKAAAKAKPKTAAKAKPKAAAKK